MSKVEESLSVVRPSMHDGLAPLLITFHYNDIFAICACAMSSNLKVSVVMPVFNGAEYLAEAINSALAQSYPNIEILVINDGSTDGGQSREIARSYGDRIRYFEQENKGVAGALNRGLSEMTGDIFCWLSHDDRFRPEKIARQVQALRALNRDDVVLYTDYALIDCNGREIRQVRMSSIVRGKPELALFRGCICGCTIFIPRQLFEHVGQFDERLQYTQDYDLWSRMIRRYSFVHLPEILVEIRQHPNQTSNDPQAVNEGDDLWINLIESRNTCERTLISGSNTRFLTEMGIFLSRTPYLRAARHADRMAKSARKPLVSVVIPFFNQISKVLRAARSVLDQSYDNIELILVDDGSTDDLSAVKQLLSNEHRAKLISRRNGGPGAARNTGIDAASGEYIAFLDADDSLLPHKIDKQLRRMQDDGALISHTSYFTTNANGGSELPVMASGRQSGWLFPEIVANCRIAPTVMIHSVLAAAGFRFPEEVMIGEDCILWVEIAREMPILGIDEPLSIIERTDTSAAINLPKSISGLRNIYQNVSKAKYSSECAAEIRSLRVRTVIMRLILFLPPAVVLPLRKTFNKARTTGVMNMSRRGTIAKRFSREPTEEGVALNEKIRELEAECSVLRSALNRAIAHNAQLKAKPCRAA
jgi:glycosyltransferase involved in cell wall biosynthesis